MRKTAVRLVIFTQQRYRSRVRLCLLWENMHNKSRIETTFESNPSYSYKVVGKDESEAKNVDKVEDAPVMHDGPCLIPCMKVLLIDMFQTTDE